MSRDGALRPAPEDLGQAADIDSFAVEAGVILLDRFCALDRVQRSAIGWSAPVTDLKRQLGHTPHHRMRLEFLRAGDAEERKLRRAVRLMTEVQPVVHAWIRAREGVLLLTDPLSGSPATTPLTEAEGVAVGLALTATLSQLHAAGVTGVAFSPESLHVIGRDVKIVGYDHLLVGGTAEEDVHRLADLLEFLSGNALSAVLRPVPNSAVELWERIRTRHDGAGARKLTLPTTPPFVGREDVLAKLMDGARRARGGTAQVVFVRGDAGMGRTRLLRRLEVEVDRWLEALIASGNFKVGAPGTKTGFVEVLDTLARQPTSLGTAEHDALRDRIRAAAGPLLGMVAALDPTIAQWLGTSALPANLQLNERFGQHAATLANALRAVGTPRRPLVVLLDDMDLADPGSRAVLQELMNGPTNHHTLVVATCARLDDCVPSDARDPVKLEIGPLDRIELRDLLDRSMPGPLADRDGTAEILWQVCRGQPQVAWSAMQEWVLRDAWALDDAIGGWRLRTERVESTLARDPYAAKWHALPPHQQWVALIAALRAGRSTIPWLGEVTAWNETEVRNAVQASVDASLLVAQPDGGLRFVNDSVRQMIAETVSDEVRANGHRQIADWLERQPGSSHAQRAWHREQSQPAGRDERLADLHVRGGQELLAIYDLERARWHFDKAMERATAPMIWVDALEGRGDVALIEGRTDAALDDYLQGMTYGGDPIRGLEVAAKAIHGFHRKSASEAANQLACRALEVADEPMPSGTLATIFSLVWALLTIRMHSPAGSSRVRDALCRVYTSLAVLLLTERPLSGLLCILRGVRHARGLDSENAAAILAFYGALWAALGQRRAATQISTEAEAVARRSGRSWGLGVVLHMRAQDEATVGHYQQASESFDQAVEQFRLAGDLSVAVFSHSLRAFYARENTPIEQILAWCDEGQACARRQGNTIGLLGLGAFRLYVTARRKDPEVAAEADALSRTLSELQRGDIDLINAHAFLAMAFAHLGQPERAWTHASTATERLEAVPAAAPDYLFDAYIATAMTVEATPDPTPAQRRALKRALRALHARGRSSPRLAAAWQLHTAKERIARRDYARAGRLLDQVITEYASHRQSAYAMEAHRLLAEIEYAHDAVSAERHRTQATALAVALGIEAAPQAPAAAPQPPGAVPQPPAAAPPPAPAPTPLDRLEPALLVEPVVRRLVPAFGRALPRNVSLRLDVAPGVQVRCNAEALQLLVVNLVLAARDALRDHGRIVVTIKPVKLEPLESARLPGATGDSHLLVEARAFGYTGSEVLSGIGVCSEITASIGGFVDVRQEPPDVLVLAAYLSAVDAPPAEATAQSTTPAVAEAVVVHPDPRVRQTVVSALRDLGLSAEGLDPALPGALAARDAIVFAEADWLFDRPGHPRARTVILHQRGTPAPSGGIALRVPFTITEIQGVVDAVTNRGPTESA